MKHIFALLVVLSPTTAAAQSHCPGHYQLDINFCAQEKWADADGQLNQLWKQVKPLADARGTGQALLAEQRAWLKRRDATCEPELEAGGSADQMFYWSCMEELTLQRSQVLRSLR